VYVEKYVNDAFALFQQPQGVKLTNQSQGLTVLADSLLRQLFYNLIDNTLKHGEKTTQIRIYFEATVPLLKLIYEDNGIGIPNSQRETLFEEKSSRGINHGLYIVRRICEAYDWSVAETGKFGQGAQFILSTPERLVKTGVT